MRYRPNHLLLIALLLLGVASMSMAAKTAEHARDPRLPLGRNPRERIAAWDKVIAATDETVPNSAVLTYFTKTANAVYFNNMAKLMPVLTDHGKTLMPSQATGLKVEDFHGGVAADCQYGKVALHTELIPLMVGRGEERPEGLVLYRVTTTPSTPIEIRIGGGDKLGFVWGPSALLRNDEVMPFPVPVDMKGTIATTQGGMEEAALAISTSGKLEVVGENETLIARLDSGKGYVLVALAGKAERAQELLGTDIEAAEQELKTYYANLMSSYIKTPEPALDQAFNDVFYNLEYNWIEPYGWMECAHHWLVMWHMQATSGAEWMGQVDRSRMSNLVHMDKLMANGAIPQLSAGGQARRTFGGSNQFWAWQIRHFWNFTGETAFAKRAAKTLERVIEQTFEEHDDDNDHLIGWGKQIGNQEDFIFTPRNGSTSSMEAINMLRTRAELAQGLGDKQTAVLWNAKAESIRSRLINQLWLPDLGRFAFHNDSQGNLRLDGQYHTFIYPLLFDIVDPLDGYTSLRHMRDRLTGPDGEVYLSNNFPTHMVGTWGMQAGAAQQPWAAWGLSAAGLRNETYRPLKAVAEWVGDLNHRGGWPEVSKETAPGYFTPPAGLFVASVCEALYGLKMHAPQGAIEISPSFPDAWPSASLDLPEFGVEYRRTANKLEYALKTKQKLARKLRWKLPPSRVKSVALDGEKIDFHLEPGVGYTTLVADAPPTRESRFTVELAPIDFTLQHPQSIAEGDEFGIRAKGIKIVGIDDRHGVLGVTSQADGQTLTASIRKGLLAPYEPYGRLGQLNFSRRTFFVKCEADGGKVSFWQPIDLTILPRSEAAPASEIEVTKSGLTQTLKIRNNTRNSFAGTALLQTIRHDFPFKVKLDARSEGLYTVKIPSELATLFSLGDNQASLILPNGEQHDLTLTLNSALSQNPELGNYFSSRIVEIPLAAHATIPDTEWAGLRNHPERHGGVSWPAVQAPMSTMDGQTRLTVPGLEGLEFKFNERRFVPVAHDVNRPELRLDLEGKLYKKIYILMFTLVDGHEIFSPIGHVTLRGERKVIKTRTLFFPGDVDWFDASHPDAAMSTANQDRPNRFDLLPQLASGQADWIEGQAPAFPQAEYWASSRVHRTGVSNLNVVEIDLKYPMELRQLVLEPVGPTPAFGVLAVMGEVPGDLGNLKGNRWLPPAKFRPARTIFDFESAADLADWKLKGNAFRVSPAADQPPSLNSLAQGETGTGTATSPPFTLLKGENLLEVMLQGGNSRQVDGAENLCLRLVDAKTGKVLRELTPPGSHVLTAHAIPADGLAGRLLRLVLRDQNSESSYAWIGIRHVSARAQEE